MRNHPVAILPGPNGTILASRGPTQKWEAPGGKAEPITPTRGTRVAIYAGPFEGNWFVKSADPYSGNRTLYTLTDDLDRGMSVGPFAADEFTVIEALSETPESPV